MQDLRQPLKNVQEGKKAINKPETLVLQTGVIFHYPLHNVKVCMLRKRMAEVK